MLFGRFASRRSEARYPTLWDGLIGAWCPSVQNPSGITLLDLSGYGRNGTLTNMDAPTDWVYSAGRRCLDLMGRTIGLRLRSRQQLQADYVCVVGDATHAKCLPSDYVDYRQRLAGIRNFYRQCWITLCWFSVCMERNRSSNS